MTRDATRCIVCGARLVTEREATRCAACQAAGLWPPLTAAVAPPLPETLASLIVPAPRHHGPRWQAVAS